MNSIDNAKSKAMLALEDELVARIKRGEPIHVVREWFIQELAGKDLKFDDLLPFAQAFFNQMIFAFEAWQREQEELPAEERDRKPSLH